ncbi:RNA-binding protein 48 isoform X2 [Cynara cardunculus var. scolymus]|uniref:RNA-binding protein 48 isoform X2 n=1 Tax=Cynara cardunculus var. scolymus TaxID=59895 RepID=UPI000D62436E|nr:RNA-binding protein 48 isoform X2 [Cynara cardunculus var. scolymus]
MNCGNCSEDTVKLMNLYHWMMRIVSHLLMFIGSSFIRFAKRKLDESVFIGNRLQVSYAPQYESLSDTKEKLEGRRLEVLARLNPGRSKSSTVPSAVSSSHSILLTTPSQTNFISQPSNIQQSDPLEPQPQHFTSTVSSNQDYFPSESMNQTVRLVREKLNKIESDAETLKAGSSKRARTDNRRRI